MRKYKVSFSTEGITLKTVIIEASNKADAFSKAHNYMTPNDGYTAITVTAIKKG